MDIDPEKAWKWAGSGNYFLGPKDRIFVGVTRQTAEANYEQIAWATIEAEGLVPVCYKGIDRIPRSSNIHHDALSDLYECQAVVLVLAKKADGKICDPSWIYEEYKGALGRGAVGMLVASHSGKNSESENLETDNYLCKTDIKNVSNASEFGAILKQFLSDHIGSK